MTRTHRWRLPALLAARRRRLAPAALAFAVAAVPFATATSAEARSISSTVRMCGNWNFVDLTIRGDVPDRTAPGEQVQITNLSGSIRWDYGMTWLPTIGSSPAGGWIDLNKVTFDVEGATTATTEITGLPAQLGPFPRGTGTGVAGYSFGGSLPTGLATAPVTTAGSGPVALRIASIEYGAATIFSPTGTLPPDPTRPTLANSTCAPRSNDNDAVAAVQSTGDIAVTPTITSVSPASGPLEGGNTVTIKGNGFTGAKHVTATANNWTGINGTIVVEDDSTLRWRPSPWEYGSEHTLRVVGRYGTSDVNPAATYRYGGPLEPYPTLESISPSRVSASAGKTTFTLRGTGLDKVNVLHGMGVDNPPVIERDPAGRWLRTEVEAPEMHDIYASPRRVWVQSTANCGSATCGSTGNVTLAFYNPTADAAGFPVAPTAVTAVRDGDHDEISWSSAATGSAAVKYLVVQNYQDVVAVTSGTSASIDISNGGGRAETYTVRAVDADGDKSRHSLSASVQGDQPDLIAPGTPSRPTVETVDESNDGGPPQVRLTWTSVHAPGEGWPMVSNVYIDGQYAMTGRNWTATLFDLDRSVSHRVKIQDLDAAGNSSFSEEITVPASVTPSPEPTPTASPTPTPAPALPALRVKGSVTLKSVASGSVSLTGHLSGPSLQGSTYTGNLSLAEASANLVALGFLPVKANLELVPAPLTGPFANGQLEAKVTTKVKVAKAAVLGIALGGGKDCQTKNPSVVPLRGAFSPTSGGTLTGTFAISNLTGCGALTGLISPLTAGKNNAIALTLSA